MNGMTFLIGIIAIFALVEAWAAYLRRRRDRYPLLTEREEEAERLNNLRPIRRSDLPRNAA